MIEFTIPGTPIPKARYRPNKWKKGGYTPSKKQEDDFRLLTKQYKPDEPMKGPIGLWVSFYVLIPASWSKKKRQRAIDFELLPEVKPDFDNLVKLTADAMNKTYWIDDAQVCWCCISIFYGAEPRTEIKTFELTKDNFPGIVWNEGIGQK